MKKSVRLKMVRAMELLARAVNNEEVFDIWLYNGVADGDINGTEDDESLEYYLNDATFSDLMDTFLILMTEAQKDGGLYVDNIVSMDYEDAEKRYGSNEF